MSDIQASFKYYYDTLKNGTYVAAVPTEETIESIKKLQKRLNLKNPVPEEDMHVTIMYSKRGNPDLPPSDTFKVAEPLTFKLYGENKNCLVLVLDSPDFEMRHQQLAVYGLAHTFTPYSPHITLTYDYQGENFDDEFLYDGKGDSVVVLEFDKEYIEPLGD